MASSNKKALLIINRKSRSGDVNLEQGIQYLAMHNISVDLQSTIKSDEISPLISKHRDSVDMVIIGGGDGTFNCAAKGLLESKLPAGLLPLGTANDLAQTLGIPNELNAALDVVVKGKIREIGLGCVNEVYFFNASSIGLGVQVTRELSNEKKGTWGVLSYAHSAWDAFKTNRSFSAKVVCDGEVRNMRSIQITVGNGRFYGGGMVVAEDAAIDDHCLEFYSLKPQSFWQLLSMARAMRMGYVKDKLNTITLRGKQIEIHTRKHKAVSTDGEITTHTPAKYTVIDNAVRVFTP